MYLCACEKVKLPNTQTYIDNYKQNNISLNKTITNTRMATLLQIYIHTSMNVQTNSFMAKLTAGVLKSAHVHLARAHRMRMLVGLCWQFLLFQFCLNNKIVTHAHTERKRVSKCTTKSL